MVTYCWNYEEGSSCGHLLLELLQKEASVVIYYCNYCKKAALAIYAAITEEGSSCGHLLLELL